MLPSPVMTTDRYLPSPIDTSGVEVPPALSMLAERLAENVHELWASQRLADGWRQGPARDDARKLHPGLVPYANLPESEKVYDRLITAETLKAILALGFRIVGDEP